MKPFSRRFVPDIDCLCKLTLVLLEVFFCSDFKFVVSNGANSSFWNRSFSKWGRGQNALFKRKEKQF